MENTKTTYKGFNKNLVCNNYQFEIDKLHEHAGKVEICKSGFHSCENPLHVLRYYNPANSRFFETEISEDIQTHHEDSKNVSRKIKLKAELTLKDVFRIGFKFLFENIKWEDKAQTHGDSSAAQTHGDYSAAQTHGNSSAAQTHGYYSAAQTHGDYSTAQTHGNSSAAQTHGYSSAAQTHGYYSTAQTHGDYSAAQTHGDSSAAQTHGDYSAAQTHGNSSAAQTHGYSSAAQTHGNSSAAQTHGKESISVSTGINGKAAGKIGNWLVLVEWQYTNDTWTIVESKTVKVDGVLIKEDTFYTLKNGNFIES